MLACNCVTAADNILSEVGVLLSVCCWYCWYYSL